MTEPTATGFDLNRPTIIGLLFAAGYFTGLTWIIGVVLCYVWKGEAPESWEATHYDYHIRTFWGGVIGTVVGVLLLIVLIGFVVWFVFGIWALVRVVLQLVNAQKRAAMPNPGTWLV